MLLRLSLVVATSLHVSPAELGLWLHSVGMPYDDLEQTYREIGGADGLSLAELAAEMQHRTNRAGMARPVVLKSLDGRSYTVDVEHTATVLDVERALAGLEGAPPPPYMIILNGRKLAPTTKLEDVEDLNNVGAVHVLPNTFLDQREALRTAVEARGDDQTFGPTWAALLKAAAFAQTQFGGRIVQDEWMDGTFWREAPASRKAFEDDVETLAWSLNEGRDVTTATQETIHARLLKLQSQFNPGAKVWTGGEWPDVVKQALVESDWDVVVAVKSFRQRSIAQMETNLRGAWNADAERTKLLADEAWINDTVQADQKEQVIQGILEQRLRAKAKAEITKAIADEAEDGPANDV